MLDVGLAATGVDVSDTLEPAAGLDRREGGIKGGLEARADFMLV